MNPDWVVPTPEEVNVAVGALVDDNLKRLFFAELRNPNWLEPLAALQVFATDPDVFVDDTGQRSAPPWPEGDYLVRVAAEAPDLVTDLLFAHAGSENPWVHRIVLEAALAVPPSQSARLVPQIAQALRSGWDFVDADSIVSLAELLADVPKRMRQLLAAAFEPVLGGEEATAFGSRPRVGSSIDSYWYAELAPRVARLLAQLGLDGVKAGTGWLIRAMDISSAGEDTGYQTSHVWRPSIAPHEQNSDIDEIANAVVDMVRDTATAVAVAGNLRDVVDFLTGQNRELMTRIAVEVTAQALASDTSGVALATAQTLLLDQTLLDLDVRPEYLRLALAAFPHLPDDAIVSWRAMVDSEEWQGQDDHIRRVAAWRTKDEAEVTDDDIAAVRRSLRYRLLLPLEEVLPAALLAELSRLKSEFGDLSHPEFGSYMTSFTGPTSPVEQEELAALAPGELFDFLSTWQPGDDRHFGPSIEGLARELAIVAEKHPELVAQLATRLLALPRSYVKAAVDGWTKALRSGFEPTPEVWEMLTALVQLPDTGADTSADFEADHPVWRWAQRSAADFAEAYVSAGESELSEADAERTWAVLLPLTGHADPTPEHEERFGGSNMDPLTLSLNTVRPDAIRASVKPLRAIADREDSPTRSEIWSMLSEHVGASKDPSLAVAAAVGEAVGHLDSIDRPWIDARTGDLFDVLSPDDAVRAHADVVVSVALRIYRTGRAFLDLMRPVILTILSPEYLTLDHTEGWRGHPPAVQAAASHVLMACVLGIVENNDPLLDALTSPEVPPTVMGDALGRLGWTLMRSNSQEDQAEPVPADVLSRARQLIDRRVGEIRAGRASPAELAGFYWWIRAELYPAAWSLPILELAGTDPEFDPKGMLGESLARAAEVEPTLALHVFDALLTPTNEGWKRYDMLRHAPRILAAALLSGDENTKATARQILDRLGREGHMSILADTDVLTSGDGRD